MKPRKTKKNKDRLKSESPLEIYLHEINSCDLLTLEDEQELARLIAQGDAWARNILVECNLRLVVNIARSFCRRGLQLQDLIEEGNLGLVRASEKYDLKHGTRFSTYACYWIKQSIKKALLNNPPSIRIPAYMTEIINRWRRAGGHLTEVMKRPPFPEEVARRMGLALKRLPAVMKAMNISANASQTDNQDAGYNIGDMLPDERQLSPDDELLMKDSLISVFHKIKSMDPRHAKVLTLRFGLDGNEVTTLKGVGENMGLTRERVRQLESEALDILRNYLDGEHGA